MSLVKICLSTIAVLKIEIGILALTSIVGSSTYY